MLGTVLDLFSNARPRVGRGGVARELGIGKSPARPTRSRPRPGTLDALMSFLVATHRP
jgi:hypothetical protein